MKIYIKESYSVKLPTYLKDEIKSLFRDYGLQRYYGFFINHVELLPLVANLMNWAAKTISYSYYDHKDSLLRYIIEHYPRSWVDKDEGVVFFETSYGQVSFHVDDATILYAEKMGISSEGREWDRSNTQQGALELIKMVIDDIEEHYFSKIKI